jgi:antitoxin (DNA-binding transcriptional repressor) of toxin-antitoxin stability system
MKKARISELKDRLSEYLRLVRGGESVLVYDRDRPIARIDPIRDANAGQPDDWTALEERGILRRPAATLPAAWLERRPHTRGDVIAALLEDRESGR